MERIATGIAGLDGLIEGGFPKPSSILLVGPTGTGKSVFGTQYLYKGALDHDEPGFLVDIAGYSTSLQWNSERFGWDINKLQKKGKMVFTSYDPADFEKLESRSMHNELIIQLNKVIDQVGAKRVVIDSVTQMGQALNDPARFRTLLYYLSRDLKEKGCTTIFIAETEKEGTTPFGVEPYVMDGVIELSHTPREGILNQTLMIRKMIATKFPTAKYLVDFGPDGMELATTYY